MLHGNKEYGNLLFLVGGILLVLVLFSFIFPLVLIGALVLFLVFLGWYIYERIVMLFDSSPRYDEDGARYTQATMISKESTPSELPDGKDESPPS
jgi:hypothetical protein